jgi:hypothetical protein
VRRVFRSRGAHHESEHGGPEQGGPEQSEGAQA